MHCGDPALLGVLLSKSGSIKISTMTQLPSSLPPLQPYSDPPAKRPWPIKRALTVTLVLAVLCVTILYFAAIRLLGNPRIAHSKSLSTDDLFNLLKLIFAVIAGIGGVVALVVAYRRQKALEEQTRLAVRTQFHAEQVAQADAYDATERRVTDLYGQSVEQLGSDKAAVRLGGLYSLERLAQGYEQQRQAVIDVVCAYLRMPFQAIPADGNHDQLPESSSTMDTVTALDKEELQVRLAAQRLIARHLRPSPETTLGSISTYWGDIRVDLNGADLIDADFTGCHFSETDFSEAQFHEGRARFADSKFKQVALFSDAKFESSADFSGTVFQQGASFTGCSFVGQVSFRKAKFEKNSGFNSARFDDLAFFEKVIFSGTTWFRRIEFKREARFEEASFGTYCIFDYGEFRGDVTFARSQFLGTGEFRKANFMRSAQFMKTSFHGRVTFKNATFNRTPRFTGVKFGAAVIFSQAHFARGVDLSGAMAIVAKGMHEWPLDWEIDPKAADGQKGKLIENYHASPVPGGSQAAP